MDLIRAYSKKGYLTQRFADLHTGLENRRSRTPEPVRPPSKTRKRHLKQSEIDDIVAKYDAGATSNQLVAATGLAKETILRLLHQHGAAIRRQGLSTLDVTQAAALYRDGRSLAWIGNLYGVSHTTVRAALIKLGVMMRDSHGREQ